VTSTRMGGLPGGLAQAWGDLGRLYWAARQEDVDAGRWEAAMFNFQCS